MVKEAKDQIAKLVRRAPRQETRRTRISRGGRRRGINSFIHCLIQNDENPWFFSGFSIIFFSDTMQSVSLQSKQYKKDVGTSTTLKHRKKDTSTKEVFHSYPTLE